VVGVFLFCPVAAVQAQSQTDQNISVVEAARKARETKKEAPKTGKVWTNDNLNRPRANPQTSQPSPASAAAEKPPQPPAGQTTASPEESVSAGSTENQEDAADLAAELSDAKRQLTDAEKDLDLAKREFDLDREQYYSNPDFRADTKGKAALDSLQQQTAAKQKQVQDLKDKVASLEAKVKTTPEGQQPEEKAPSPAQ
jgi:hypothetical protein